jgi:hypothetical protein
MGGFATPIRPRLKDRVIDDPQTRQSPDVGAPTDWQPFNENIGGMGDLQRPGPAPLPSGGERFLEGLEGQGGQQARLPLKQRLPGMAGSAARGAIGGLLGPTQRQDIEAERLGSQRVAGEHSLEAQREQFALPEQRARIEQQEAGTEQQRLATKILQRRLELMQAGGGQGGFQDMTDDENAEMAAAYATGDPKVIAQASGRIYSRRSIEGMVGPGTNVYSPDSPGGVERRFMTRGGQPMPGATQQGAVVPGTLPRTETSTQIVPTEGGGMAAVPKTSTSAPQLPGTTPRGGGGAGQARPVMGPGGTPLQPRLPAGEERAQQTAILAVSQLPYVKQEMLAIKDKLGPLSGRVMELGQVIGITDPNYSKLRLDTDAAVSAFSVIHFGARGNWQWLQEFKQNVDQGSLSYPNLVAGWQVLERWLRAYQTYGTQRPIDVTSGVNAPGVAGAR